VSVRPLRPIVAILIAASGVQAWCADTWGPYSAWKVRRTVAIPPAGAKQPKLPRLDCCYATFPTAGFLAPGGRDLRVTVSGKEAPFKIIDVASDGTVRLVAPVTSADKQMRIYYGNPKAKAAPAGWQPQRGLWLETRPYKGGDCKTLAGIRAAWAKAGERFGRGPVAQIFHGYNPFGPSDKYLSLYTGWLYLAKAASVHFAVIADDMAHLVVADKPVASKSVPGRMPRNKRFAGKPVSLRQGVHLIQMYHFEHTDRQSAGAAWWMAGMKRGKKYLHYAVIPAKSFAPLRYGRLVNYEVRGQPIGADFSYVNDGDVLVDNRQLVVRYVFRDASRPANRALQCQPLWDFGDGTTSAARDPNHIYLKAGDYTATLTLRRGEQAYKVSQKFQVGHGWHRAARRAWDKLAQYYPIIKDYQFDKMPTDQVVLAARIFEKLEKPEEIIATCSVLYRRGSQLDDKTFIHHCLLLGRHLREVEGKARDALKVFAAAERRAKDDVTRARLANEMGDVHYYYLGDLEGAMAQYTRTLTKFAKGGATQVRLAQIRLGDVYRSKGDAKAALQAYQRAADTPVHKRTELVESARRGSFPRTIEDYTRRKLFDEARQALNDWDWEFPTDKLVGFSSLLRARLALAEGNKEEAAKQAEELLGVNKDSEYADDLLLFLVDLHLGDGKLDKALTAATRLLDDYPASELQEQAVLKRVAIRLRQAKFAEAAREALRLADGNEHSDNAPKALLLAATAYLRQGKRPDAIRTLERLAKKHPTSQEAGRGLKMLKELRKP